MKPSKQLMLALVFLPLFSQADQQISLCGLTFNQNSTYNQVDQQGSGYSMRVDCNRDQKQSPTDPLVTIKEISSARKGWITRFTQNAVSAAAARGDANARSQAPYICMDVTVDQNPCLEKVHGANILSIQKMTVANIGNYMYNSDKKVSDSNKE